MNRPIIAIVDNSLGKTGALIAMLNYTEFARDEFEFIYILPADSGAVKFVHSKGYKIIQLPFLELSRNYKNIILYIPYLLTNGWRFKKIITKHNISIVHSNDFYNLVAPIANFLGAQNKLITHVRFMPNRFPGILKKIWLNLHFKYSEKIICVSNAVKSNLPQNKKISIIYDGLPEKIIKQEPIAHESIIKMLYLAHYIPGKGHDLALKAFELAIKRNPNLRLEFAGGDLGLPKNKEYRRMLEKNTRDKELMDVIQFSNEIENTSLKMTGADIFLNFSESESFSMTTLEALSLGIPVIVSDCGGPKELFVNGESGILVRNKDVKSMAEAIILLAASGDLRTKFSKNSIEYVNQKFSCSNTFNLLKILYRNLAPNA